MNSLVEIKNFLAPANKFDDQKFEFIFVLDRSGSMSGGKILLAQRALELFVRSLPTSCMFNVVSFGSTHKHMFKQSQDYTEQSKAEAITYAQLLKADMGGTNLLSPLHDIYNRPQYPGYLTQIFVVTDGEVENRKLVLNLVRQRSGRCRVFALGIGSSASRATVDGLAQLGKGSSIYVAGNEKIETKILAQLKVALQPSLLKASLLNR